MTPVTDVRIDGGMLLNGEYIMSVAPMLYGIWMVMKNYGLGVSMCTDA
jgi:hypothetical protein